MALGDGILFALLEGKGEGQTKFLQKKTGIFVKIWERKERFFSNIRAISSLKKPQKIKKIFWKFSIFSFSWPNFFEGPWFLALGEGIGFWTLGEGHFPHPPPVAHVWLSQKLLDFLAINYRILKTPFGPRKVTSSTQHPPVAAAANNEAFEMGEEETATREGISDSPPPVVVLVEDEDQCTSLW